MKNEFILKMYTVDIEKNAESRLDASWMNFGGGLCEEVNVYLTSI